MRTSSRDLSGISPGDGLLVGVIFVRVILAGSLLPWIAILSVLFRRTRKAVVNSLRTFQSTRPIREVRKFVKTLDYIQGASVKRENLKAWLFI